MKPMKELIASILLTMTLAASGGIPAYEGTAVPDLRAVNASAKELAVFEAAGTESDEGFCLREYELPNRAEAVLTCSAYKTLLRNSGCEDTRVRVFTYTEDGEEHWGIAVTVFMPDQAE